MARSEALKRAQAKYQKTHDTKKYRYKSYAKSFITKIANAEELMWLDELLHDRLKELRNKKES